MDNDYNILTYRQVDEYHEELRKIIFERVEKNYRQFDLKAREITYKNAVEADSWKDIWKKSNRKTNWSWIDMYGDYHSRGGVRRFEMALFKGTALVSLCYGMLERNRVILKLHAIEQSPIKKSTVDDAILDINLYAAQIYANLNGSNEIWLCNPVSPAHVRLYQRKGYEPHENHLGKVTHLVTKI